MIWRCSSSALMQKADTVPPPLFITIVHRVKLNPSRRSYVGGDGGGPGDAQAVWRSWSVFSDWHTPSHSPTHTPPPTVHAVWERFNVLVVVAACCAATSCWKDSLQMFPVCVCLFVSGKFHWALTRPHTPSHVSFSSSSSSVVLSFSFYHLSLSAVLESKKVHLL